MLVSDWIQDAALEINKLVQDSVIQGGNQLRYPSVPVVPKAYIEIIAKHCPMKPDTAYMEVPRCETCQYLRRAEAHDDRGACDHLQLWVSTDFGCVAWKAK
jgi:hypothetical protein